MNTNVIKVLSGISLLIFMSACAQVSPLREHVQLQTLAQTSSTGVILPIQMSVELKTFTGENEKLTGEEQRIHQDLINALGGKLSATGLKLLPFDFKKKVEQDEEFAFELSQAFEAVNLVRRELYDPDVQVESADKYTQVSVGSALNSIANATDADIGIFLRFAGFRKSDGLITKDVASGLLLGALTGHVHVAADSGSRLEVMLIDMNSGDVLWSNMAKTNELSAGVVQIALKSFPDPRWSHELANSN